MDYDDLVRAFVKEEKKELKRMSKTKSKVRTKNNHANKLKVEKQRQELKKNILNTLTHDMHRYKRSAANISDDKTSTRLRRAISNFRQAISEI
tara:strand:+ start:361 stop:639 length:279 start_codon:yes stop_codon:yes gene_type:complete